MTPRPPSPLVGHQLRYDLRAFRRNRQAALSTLALPVILLGVLVSARRARPPSTRAAPCRSRST